MLEISVIDVMLAAGLALMAYGLARFLYKTFMGV